ncbi:biotin carboxylase 2, chloroplastic-like [Arachis stenosperma]|uniref:biotin carboxylase 2, chloroplastic-like n=1 Tax=Arachis stenosperma TaxID=217475 RepID=UPI0025ACED4F|nr:biotin carboxylase 2, chloroplastic-like [Arachis stenosperma]
MMNSPSGMGLYAGTSRGIKNSQCSFLGATKVNFPSQTMSRTCQLNHKHKTHSGALHATCQGDKILVANRGKILVRAIRTAHELGIPCMALYSTIDKDALHVKLADESVCIGEAPSSQSCSAGGAGKPVVRWTEIQSWFEDRLQDLPDDPNNELMMPKDPECNKEGQG